MFKKKLSSTLAILSLFDCTLQKPALCETKNVPNFSIPNDIINTITKSKTDDGYYIDVSDPYDISYKIYHGLGDAMRISLSNAKTPLEKNLYYISECRVRGDYNCADKNIESGLQYFKNQKNPNIEVILYLEYIYAEDLFSEGRTKDWYFVKKYIDSVLKPSLEKSADVENLHINGVDNVELTNPITENLFATITEKTNNDIPIKTSKYGYSPHIIISKSNENFDAIVDTGVLLTTIPQKYVESFNVKVIGEIKNFKISTGGTESLPFGIIKNIKINDINIYNLPAVILPKGDITVGNMLLSKLSPILISKNSMRLHSDNKESCKNNFYFGYGQGGYERNIIFNAAIDGKIEKSVLDTGLNSNTILAYKNKFSQEEYNKSEKIIIKSFGFDENMRSYSKYFSLNLPGGSEKKYKGDYILDKTRESQYIIGGNIYYSNNIYIDLNKSLLCFYKND
ncbi:hypothetical protein HLH36_17200 [Gluconacetobacter aggeris]|uniref:Aspartyl protease n=1 Tax=Gluconacetobacter aggeris TaxID=1286186 RepID=A0A7W4IW31_9PROT|nr:aspartyl protease family protein [Gluconacetobacter aggeris]MBB2170058.1 hypothetical protein [Gluconacetobacter aggeris]